MQLLPLPLQVLVTLLPSGANVMCVDQCRMKSKMFVVRGWPVLLDFRHSTISALTRTSLKFPLRLDVTSRQMILIYPWRVLGKLPIDSFVLWRFGKLWEGSALMCSIVNKKNVSISRWSIHGIQEQLSSLWKQEVLPFFSISLTLVN